MFKKLWNDEAGFIISSEIVLIGTIMVVGMVTGLTSLRDGVIEELADLGAAIGNLDQSFGFGGAVGHSSWTAGSFFADQQDFCDNANGVSFNSRCLGINGGGNFGWGTPGWGGPGWYGPGWGTPGWEGQALPGGAGGGAPGPDSGHL